MVKMVHFMLCVFDCNFKTTKNNNDDENDSFLTFIKQPANTRKPSECRCLAKENPNPESQPVIRTALLPTCFKRSDST